MIILMSVSVLMSGCGPSGTLSVEQRRQAVLDMQTETLNRLYEEQPSTREEIAKAPGYGVFSNANINIIYVSAGGGYGVVVDNQTKEKTYMKMALGGVGLGLGAKDYRQVLIFKTRSAMEQFVEKGWEFGGHADAAAKTSDKGGEVSGEGDISEDITVYAMTEAGLALQATVTGSKYWKDDKLN